MQRSTETEDIGLWRKRGKERSVNLRLSAASLMFPPIIELIPAAKIQLA